ncbi:phthiocerol/phthiodiolone dimycocerosyl transferase family protein [Nocardia tenerifensis]|nr:hypothetical protein [Nocardia tenerifensis]
MRLFGRLNLPALAAAFDAVVRAYPAFGAHLEPDGRGHMLVESSGGTPEITVVDGDPEQLLSGARLDQRAALVALCVVRDGDSTGVTLVTHHSVADACHSLAALSELWSCYTDINRGRAPDVAPHRFPAAVEDLLLSRCVEKMSGRPVVARPLVVAETPETAGPGVGDESYLLPLTARCRLSKQKTAALADVAHRTGTTINGLASAAILLTEAELRELPLSELSYTYSVDLRNRVFPPIGHTEGTNVLGFADFVPTRATGDTLVGLARGISDGLRSGLASGVVQQTPLHIPDIASGPPPRAPGIVLATNWGRIDRPRLPEGLRVNDFRTVMIAKPDKAGHRLQQPSGTIIISTFDDQLSIEIHHPVETTAQQRRRVRLLAAHLDPAHVVGAA